MYCVYMEYIKIILIYNLYITIVLCTLLLLFTFLFFVQLADYFLYYSFQVKNNYYSHLVVNDIHMHNEK